MTHFLSRARLRSIALLIAVKRFIDEPLAVAADSSSGSGFGLGTCL
jgi:hypothetical protein